MGRPSSWPTSLMTPAGGLRFSRYVTVTPAMITATTAPRSSSQLRRSQARRPGGGAGTGAARTSSRKAATAASGGAAGGTRARRSCSIVSSAIARAHQLPESRQCPRLRGAHRVRLHSKDGSYLLGGQSSHDPEFEHLPIAVRETPEGVEDLGVFCVQLQRLARALLRALRQVRWLALPALALAAHVADDVAGDPEQPGVEAAARLVAL